MKKPSQLLFAVTALALTGCGKSQYCEDFAAAGASLETKYKPCNTSGEPLFVPLSAAELQQCTAVFEQKCTAQDKETFEAGVACLNRLTTCSPANQSAFSENVGKCDAYLKSLSETCRQSVGLDEGE